MTDEKLLSAATLERPGRRAFLIGRLGGEDGREEDIEEVGDDGAYGSGEGARITLGGGVGIENVVFRGADPS